MDCVEHAAFDIATTAGYYSQLSGVLAGFAFTSVPIILTRHEAGKAGRREAQGAVALLCAFFALVLTTVMYSVLAGFDPAAAGASMFEVIAGTAFGLAILLLLHGVTAILDALYPTIAHRFVQMVVLIGPSLVLFYVAVGVNDVQIARVDCGQTIWDWLILAGYIPAGLLVITGRIILSQPSTSRIRGWWSESYGTANRLSYWSLAIAIAATAVTGVAGSRNLLPEFAGLVILIGLYVFLVLWQFTYVACQDSTPGSPLIRDLFRTKGGG